MWTATLCPPLLRFRHVPVVGASPIVRARSTARVNVSQSVNHGVRAQVSGSGEKEVQVELRTCRSCKQKYNPLENHPRACRFHTAHFGGQCNQSLLSFILRFASFWKITRNHQQLMVCKTGCDLE
uniref:Uncharacterized protein n=1 Tax=Physcomitrium patens TaxID=3218 RepID=A0A7I4C9E8_PHYPA